MEQHIFTFKLADTYFDTGFFNVSVRDEEYLGADGDSIEITLAGANSPIHATINRSANTNHTPRIMGGTPLRDWFQGNCQVDDVISVIVSSPTSISIDRHHAKDNKMSDFTWLPFFEEMLSIICQKYDKVTLCEPFHKIFEGVGGTQDWYSDTEQGPLREIDPLTFIYYFNRSMTETKKLEFCRHAKELFDMKTDVPSDLLGIPSAQNLLTWFFGWEKDRKAGDMDGLWTFARQLDQNSLSNDSFRQIAIRKGVRTRITSIMFICKPNIYLSLDRRNRAYLKQHNIDATSVIKQLAKENGFAAYVQLLSAVKDTFKIPFYEISQEAYLNDDIVDDSDDELEQIGMDSGNLSTRYWIIAPGEQARLWEQWRKDGIVAIGWDLLEDLNQYNSKDEIARRLKDVYEKETSQDKAAFMVHAFVHNIQIGDIVFAKKGTKKLLGYGKVVSDYYYAPSYEEYHHVRKVEWIGTGDWELPEETKAHIKTLTEINQSSDYLKRIKKLVGFVGSGTNQRIVSGSTYWWLNANPKIWDISAVKIGEKQTYTTHNEKGIKRRIYKYFNSVQPGDVVLGYVTTPDKEITTICRITKGIHTRDEKESIEFEVIDKIVNPISYDELKTNPHLAGCEPLINNQGSLFKLSKEEYEIIREAIDEKNPPIQPDKPYSIEDALAWLFFDRKEFENILHVLRYKKNIILQGAPGVGKTFVARRLAYALMEQEAPQRVQMIQFHQSYSYEDFIQGYRPNDKEAFTLKNGVFHDFCKKAQRDPDNQYVFIIDEINRGNLSKIFGELMMLIESDKRGKDYAVPLTYALAADEKFYIPDNLYLIGTMNTADRSLALVDYALRRRFSFITLSPKYNSTEFRSFLGKHGVDDGLITKIITKMSALNEKIVKDEKNLGIGYQIGHSFFCPNNSKGLCDHEWYCRIVNHEIRPLLEEYWFDNAEGVNQSIKDLLS